MLNREYKAPKPLSSYRPKRAPSLPAVPAPNSNKLTGSQSLQFTQDNNLKQIIKPGISISPHKFLSLRAAGGSSSTRPASSSYSRTSKASKGSYNSFISDLSALNASCEQTPMNKVNSLQNHDIGNGFKNYEANPALMNSQQTQQNQSFLHHNIVGVLKVLDENKGKQHGQPPRQRNQRNRYLQQSQQPEQESKEFSCLSVAQGADSSFNSRDNGLLKQNFLVGTELQSINDSKELQKETSISKKKITKLLRQASKGRSSGNAVERHTDENSVQLLSAGKKSRKNRDSAEELSQGQTKEETLMKLVILFHASEESGTKRIPVSYCKDILQAFQIGTAEFEGLLGMAVEGGHSFISFEDAMKCFSELEGSNQEIIISLMRIVETQRRNYEEEGKYGDAKRMLAKLIAIREILSNKYQQTLRSKQQAELAGIEVAQREGFAEFVDVWERYTAEYQATAYLSLQKLQERHTSELTVLEEETRKDLLSKFRPSKKLLEMRHQEKLFAKLKQYNQAENVQYKADFLYEAERKKYSEEVEETVKSKAAALKKLHSQATSVLLKRIEADRAHQLKQRQADSTVIMIRNRNALNEAVQRHNNELKRPHDQLVQGNINLPGHFNPNLTFLNSHSTKSNLDEQHQSQRQWISGSSPSSSLADKYLGTIQHNLRERESISGSRRQRFISCKPRDKSTNI